MSGMRNIGSGQKLKGARAEIRARREGRSLLIRGILHDRPAEPPINVDELTAAIARALQEALK